jgi:multiple sugar transport system ATP-binding protein
LAAITLERVSKIYPDGTQAVNDLDLTIGDGELVVFVGPSGCGKTTALRMIAGLEDVTEGEIRIGDRVVNDLPPKSRDIAMVFQNYALYPSMTVFQNMAFGLRVRRLPRTEIKCKVTAVAHTLGLADLLDRRPSALSGGQRQRVAMGRAMVREPTAFLMDEPLSNLDAKLRVEMRAEVARIQRELHVTTVYVTHDQSEAMTLGDRVCVMRAGHLQQVAPPKDVYDHPANLFVAGFIGSPRMNLLEGQLESSEHGLAVRLGSTVITAPGRGVDRLRSHTSQAIAVGIRPEDVVLAGPGAPGDFSAVIELREDMGSDVFLHVSSPANPIDSAAVREARESASEEARRASFIIRVGRSVDSDEGDSIAFNLNPAHLHFFELETGHAI